MKIALDAMGSDFGPSVIVDGLRLFLAENQDDHVILVGRKETISPELEKTGLSNSPRISIQHADEVIEMADSPVKALRTKKNASLPVMMDLLKEGKADAVLSPGNTGAMVAAATLKLRPLSGIDRPAIATVIPTPYGKNILMDVGAVTDCKVKNYLQFAVMGSCLSKFLLGVADPRIGLLNVGEEETKGTEIIKEVYTELKKTRLNFIGNVEGRDIFKNTADVIITDGFTGNVVLKACESAAKGIFSVLKREILATFMGKIAGLLLTPTLKRVKKQFNHEEYGGALLLGVNGVVIIAHGSSSKLAIKNALKLAVMMMKKNINHEISQKLKNNLEATA
ncbi:MAG: phosphate acyltransferase PlsX [Candidatus Aureabacteria bacterium]|nr:phosphate acyltransferase PlsX [Candidatus Auribacterota bacterium]